MTVEPAPVAPALSGAIETPNSPVVIRTLDLAKAFGKTAALAGLTLSVRRGEVFGFLGPNGAGKTTAVKLLVGLTRPTGGEGWVLDAPIGDITARQRLGYLPELFRYQDWLTGREVLELHCRLARIPPARRGAQVAEALRLAGLSGRDEDRVGSYSKGMQQRLGLGVALLGEPEVVFLDEPTSALDPVGRHDVRDIIRSLKRRGTTVFLNSHLLAEVEQVCDRVAVVDRGRVISTGTLDDLRNAVKAVRVRAAGFGDEAIAAAKLFGNVRFEGATMVVGGVGEAEVPRLIRTLVAAGVDIYAVQPAATLEDSFLNLLEAQDHSPAHRGGSHTS